MTTSDDDYEDDYVETPEEGYQCLADVFEWWDAFREACGPISQADALVAFANALFHLRNVMERWGNEANMLPLAASESPDPQRLWDLLVDSRRDIARLRGRIDSLETELAQARAGWPAEEARLLDNVRTAEHRARRATMVALSYAAERDRLRRLLKA